MRFKRITYDRLPHRYSLSQNIPNPFNPTTTIKYSLKNNNNVRIEIYNQLGQQIRVLLDVPIEAGDHQVEFDANGLPSGVYYYRIQAGNFSAFKKMVLLK